MAQHCQGCGRALGPTGTRAGGWRLRRLFGRSRVFCFTCWEERLAQGARRQRNALLGLAACNLALLGYSLLRGAHREAVTFLIIGLSVLVCYLFNRLIHREIRLVLARFKDRWR